MKIKIFSTNDTFGGASRACFRLFNSLKHHTENDVKLNVAQKFSNDFNVIPINKFKNLIRKILNRLEKTILRFNKTSNKIFHSLGLFGVIRSSEINSSDSDIINVHWINLSFMSIYTISKIKKPVVITLHDSWFFCGCEHHPISNSDSRFKNGYITENFSSLNKLVWKEKKRVFKNNLNFIAPSKWIYKNAKQSPIFRDNDIIHIPNPLDTETFMPHDKSLSKQKYGFDVNSKVVLFGVFGDPNEINNKGIDLLLKSLELINDENFICICIGHMQEDILVGKIKIKFLGRIHDEKELSYMYSLADVVVIPSRMENLTQMGTESMSCGTPVVAFDVGGNCDIIDKATGILVQPYNVNDFSKAIVKILKLNINDYKLMSKKCRRKAELNWSSEIVAKKYNEYFNQIINQIND